jgi:hypothetical protein
MSDAHTGLRTHHAATHALLCIPAAIAAVPVEDIVAAADVHLFLSEKLQLRYAGAESSRELWVSSLVGSSPKAAA